MAFGLLASSWSEPSVLATSSGGYETSVKASLPACPAHLRRGSSRLQDSSSRYTGDQRLERAWRAGNWAGAVLRGRIASPNRTQPLISPGLCGSWAFGGLRHHQPRVSLKVGGRSIHCWV